jgi:transcriptional regulator with XRE-family HTH domain
VSPYSASPERIAAPNLAKRLTERMGDRHISIRRLAEVADVNKATIVDWRKGRVKSVRLDLAERVAAALDTSAENLLDLPANPRTGTPRSTTEEIGPLVTRLEGLLTELNGAVKEARRVRGRS